jgi:hypothetical protein
MKEEIARIMRLVQEGKLTPEDAAELIDALNANESQESEPDAYQGDAATPPPPPGSHEGEPFRHFMDTIENLGKEVTQSVNWHEVARQVREGTKKGMEGLKTGMEQLKEGKVNFGWFSAYETKDVTLPLPTLVGKTLRVENPCGDVKISGGFEEGSVSARARIRGADAEDAHLKANDYTVIIEESEHRVLIRQPDVSGLEVDLVIQLKEASQVDVKTSAGDVVVLDTGGGCRVTNQSGDIKLRGLSGSIEISTQNGDLTIDDCRTPSLAIENKSGDITLTNVAGNLNARSASGDVLIVNGGGQSISVESVNGDVTVDLVEPVTGTVSIRTVNGDATMKLPEGCDCRVSLSTLRGDASCGVELQDEAKMDQRITGRLGLGNGSLDVSAVNGDVSLRERKL